MTEQLISLETAKLAKEKGFSVGSKNYYNLRYGDLRTCGEDNSGFDSKARPSNGNDIYAIVEAPTQALLQKWLREEHGLDIVIDSCWADLKKTGKEYIPWVLDRADETFEDDEAEYYPTYEEALEAGLKESLELL